MSRMSWGESGPRMFVPSRINWLTAGWLVLAAAVALTLLGSTVISTAFGNNTAQAATYSSRHLVFGMLGFVLAATAMSVHYRRVAVFSWPIAIVCIALLLILLVPFMPKSIVTARNGARRWIDLGFTDFQPSELAKIAFVLVIAGYLRHRSTYRSLMGLVPLAVIALVPMGLIVVQPDLGTALLFIPVLFAMLVAAGAKLKHLIATCVLGVVASGVIVGACLVYAEHDKYPILQKHQVNRIRDVVSRYQGDDSQASEASYQGTKATMLAGAGGFSGNNEVESRAMISGAHLPEAHNDMVFAVLLNRFGFMGALATLGLYALWTASALRVAAVCKDPFGRIVVVGLAATTVTSTLMHIGENIGLLPITGITLPFVSYGGTSLLASYVMTGMIVGIGLRRPDYLWRKSFEFHDDT